jgi:hypothetical protein
MATVYLELNTIGAESLSVLLRDLLLALPASN